MNASAPPPRATAWTHWYRRILPAYWIFLLFGTHLPNLRLTIGPDAKGWSVHVGGFGLLAFLFWRFVETFRRPLSGRFVWIAGAGLVVYAGLDEYLQQFTQRSTNIADWLCNVVAIVAVLGVLEWQRRRRSLRHMAQSDALPGHVPGRPQ